MKQSKLLLSFIILALAIRTVIAGPEDTDTNFFYVLHCRDESFTNATVESLTAATATVFWPGGGKEVLLSDFPVEMQKMYHYDPAAARAFLDARAQKKAAARDHNARELEAMTDAMNELEAPRMVQVVKGICSYEVEILDQGAKTNAYIVNLPKEVIDFVNDFNDTAATVNLNFGFNASATYQFTDGFHHAGELTDAAKVVSHARAHLEYLQTIALEKTTIVAQPSRLVRNGFRFWKYGDPAPTSVAAMHRSELALKLRVPIAVYNQIANEAARLFPNDYEEQYFVVGKQLQAYKALHPD